MKDVYLPITMRSSFIHFSIGSGCLFTNAGDISITRNTKLYWKKLYKIFILGNLWIIWNKTEKICSIEYFGNISFPSVVGKFSIHYCLTSKTIWTRWTEKASNCFSIYIENIRTSPSTANSMKISKDIYLTWCLVASSDWNENKIF